MERFNLLVVSCDKNPETTEMPISGDWSKGIWCKILVGYHATGDKSPHVLIWKEPPEMPNAKSKGTTASKT